MMLRVDNILTKFNCCPENNLLMNSLKLLLTLMLLPILSNCTQYSSLVGPSYTFVETGNILQSTTSLTSSLTMNSIKKNFIHEVKSENICQTVHTSELNEIFFETVEQMDCYYDPMSIYR